jgi:catechol 2,3-dioxygenase-like lactoylglutathione lyase family enzyme
MPKVHQITPFLHVPDLESALAFLCGTLGFETKLREVNYAYLEFGGCGFRILEERTRKLTLDGKARVSVYIDVSDVDEIHAKIREKLDKLPPDSVDQLANKSWKQREFQVRLPDGDWLTFGQPVA